MTTNEINLDTPLYTTTADFAGHTLLDQYICGDGPGPDDYSTFTVEEIADELLLAANAWGYVTGPDACWFTDRAECVSARKSDEGEGELFDNTFRVEEFTLLKLAQKIALASEAGAGR